MPGTFFYLLRLLTCGCAIIIISMKKIFIFFLLIAGKTKAQELFVFTEPASNMPAKSLGIRLQVH